MIHIPTVVASAPPSPAGTPPPTTEIWVTYSPDGRARQVTVVISSGEYSVQQSVRLLDAHLSLNELDLMIQDAWCDLAELLTTLPDDELLELFPSARLGS